MSEDAAATKIQAVWRGRQARKEVAVIRQQTAEGKKHQEALKATLWSNTSSMEIQPEASKDQPALKTDESTEEILNRHKKVHEDAYARAKAIQDKLAEDIAATKIQAVWRGKQARKQYAVMKAEADKHKRSKSDFAKFQA